jgi:hypothetical protein
VALKTAEIAPQCFKHGKSLLISTIVGIFIGAAIDWGMYGLQMWAIEK